MSEKVIPVKVALRIRPLNSKEKSEACTECLRTVPNEQQVVLGKNKAFTYDYVFSKDSLQAHVYDTSVQSLLDSLFKGYNATVLAYGQTGSGKTHTMGSGYSTLCLADGQVDEADFEVVGVIPRVLNDLFNTIEDIKEKEPGSKFVVKVSFVEVYNEEIKDLFCSTGVISESLSIREENNSIRVVGLSETVVDNSLSTIQLLQKGSNLRMTGGTAMNEESSRSHAIFTIILEQKRVDSEFIRSKFHLVDLAGSERQSKTKAEGIRLREGININLGLLALGNVISVLGEDNVKHIPYRESKLTRLLQDSLGGNSHTLMIVCASPATSNMEESLNSLRYADRARKIKNKPILNIDPKLAELNTLKEQVKLFKEQILQLTAGAIPEFNGENGVNANKLKIENEKLKIENSRLFKELNRMITINRNTYEKMTKLESEREDQKQKFDKIKSAFKQLTKTPDDEESSKTFDNCTQLINKFQVKLNEIESVQEKELETSTETDQNSENNESDNNTDHEDKEFTLRQAQMQYQLTEYDTNLQRKQALHSKMLESLTQSHGSMDNMTELKSRIELLEAEKSDLQRVVSSNDRSITSQKKERLRSLESEVTDLRRKEKDLQRMIKLKEENEKQCEKLKHEITQIKRERIKLIKQMKTDNDNFKKFRAEKEKEVTHMKAQERKRLVEISKLQTGNSRNENILKRKNDEINRIQKQLRESVAKQKLVANQRQQTFDRKDSSQLGDKLRSWITHELELSVGIAEARSSLTKLIEEKKQFTDDLIKATNSLQEMNKKSCAFPPPNKQRKQDMNSTYIASAHDDIDSNIETKRTELERRIERLNEEVEMKKAQIEEIQSMVIEDEKSKFLFNNILLIESKVLLKHLFSLGTQYLLDLRVKQASFEAKDNGFNRIQNELKETKSRFESTQNELEKYKIDNKSELARLVNHYEQRIVLLLKSGIQNAECISDDRYSIVMDQLKKINGNKLENVVPRSTCDQNFAKLTAKPIKRDHRRTRVLHENNDPLLAENSSYISY